MHIMAWRGSLISATLGIIKTMRHSFFIALEGIDGAGKDTIAAMVSRHTFDGGKSFFVTEEPSAGQTGVLIRDILDGKVAAPKTNKGLQSLFVEDRLDHIRSTVLPLLQSGKWVLSVRYWLSTLAYGMLEGEVDRYTALHREVIGGEMIYPDVTIVLDITAEEGLRRIRQAGRAFDWYAKLEMLPRIRKNYLTLAQRNDIGRIVVIDAMQPTDTVAAHTIAVITNITRERA